MAGSTQISNKSSLSNEYLGGIVIAWLELVTDPN